MSETTPAERTVAFVVFDGLQLLDLAGPLDVVRAATLLGAEPPYATVVVSPTGEPVRTESDLTVGVDGSLADLASGNRAVHTLVVPGGLGARELATDDGVVAQVRAVAERAVRVTSVCTGAVLLAATGLLDGRAATTHWGFCDDLAAAHPDVDVRPDQIYARDGKVWTSAGVTAGIDLFLALVEDDHGADLAHQVAGWLVMFVRRPGGQSQFSVEMRARPAATLSIADLQRWLPDHLGDDLSVEALARRAQMSPRTFARVFKRETGTTPAAYVEALRIEAARRLLESTGLTIEAIAGRVGLRHGETLHRAFRRAMGTTPDRYRQHFGRSLASTGN